MLTEIVFILDRSGSMSGLEKDTIGGFNSMMEKQKKEKGEACSGIRGGDGQPYSGNGTASFPPLIQSRMDERP